MERNKHTPGPWTFQPERGTPGNDDNDKGGFFSPSGPICDFGNGTTYYPREGEPPNEADARLMAAAPELLEALKAAYGWIETCPEGDAATKLAIAAIQKATGETNC